MKFKLGQLVLTMKVNATIAGNSQFSEHVFNSLKRHAHGDWGELCQEDRSLNELSMQEGGRLFSVYKKDNQPTIWIITEWDRSLTTVLFPDEY